MNWSAACSDGRTRAVDRGGRSGVPQVVSVGATDMVNFGPPETIPDRFRTRRFHQHNADCDADANDR
jgi:uncharacterized protein (UPF0261 family)